MGDKSSKLGIKIIADGEKARIFSYINDQGNDVIEQYVGEEMGEEDQMQIFRLLELFTTNGEIRNKEKFKKLDGTKGIFEFKTDKHRILCFILSGMNPKSLLLTNCFKKEKNRTPKVEIEKAEKVKNRIVELYKNNKLNLIGD
jgi:hypothetical protein